jgi:hypothetical protein
MERGRGTKGVWPHQHPKGAGGFEKKICSHRRVGFHSTISREFFVKKTKTHPIIDNPSAIKANLIPDSRLSKQTA